jgi:hypothetical protein
MRLPIFTRALFHTPIAFVMFLISPSLVAVEHANVRLASEPAIASNQLVFAYANDLWIAGRDGSAVRRLTSHSGVESGPAFSPDGSLIAFTGRYEGNTDVYVVPSMGGLPRPTRSNKSRSLIPDAMTRIPHGSAISSTSGPIAMASSTSIPTNGASPSSTAVKSSLSLAKRAMIGT